MTDDLTDDASTVDMVDETDDDSTADTTTDAADDDAIDEIAANDDVLSNDSSSGCSIGGTSVSNDPMFLILSALALLMLGLRRTPLRRLLKAPKITTASTAAV